MTLYLLKVHLSIPINKKYQILSCDSLVANEQYRKADQKYREVCKGGAGEGWRLSVGLIM
jgi:hypothetical protein